MKVIYLDGAEKTFSAQFTEILTNFKREISLVMKMAEAEFQYGARDEGLGMLFKPKHARQQDPEAITHMFIDIENRIKDFNWEHYKIARAWSAEAGLLLHITSAAKTNYQGFTGKQTRAKHAQAMNFQLHEILLAVNTEIKLDQAAAIAAAIFGGNFDF